MSLKKIFLVGIGGSGMSSLAFFLAEKGYVVSGSDISETKITKNLQTKGIKVYKQHMSSNIDECDAVVFSSAIAKNNKEIAAAKAKKIPVLHRSQMLAEAIKGQERIIVSGTHGKTTTAAIITSLLFLNSKKPSFVIGGEITKAAKSALFENGESVVIEADESDGSLKSFCADIGVVTNIEEEHFDYYSSKKEIEDVFAETVNASAEKATWIYCSDDLDLRRLMETVSRKTVGYGLSEDAEVRALNVKRSNGFMEYDYSENNRIFGKIKLNMMGTHNVLNSLPAVYIALQKGISFVDVADATQKLSGVGRRMDLKFSDGNLRVIDDYAHHPTEVKATIDALKNMFDEGRIICVFQPHRFSRLVRFEKDFASSFAGIDKLYVTDIYSAGEANRTAATSASLVEKIVSSRTVNDVSYVPLLADVTEALLDDLTPGDLICFMGAGDVSRECEHFVRILKR